MEQGLLRQAPGNTDIGRLKAWDTMRSGEEIVAGGDPAQALEKYRDAMDQFQACRTPIPKNAQFHNDLAAVLARIGAARLAQGNARTLSAHASARKLLAFAN